MKRNTSFCIVAVTSLYIFQLQISNSIDADGQEQLIIEPTHNHNNNNNANNYRPDHQTVGGPLAR